ncbi:uncharacterized protein AAGF69_008790 [Amazona ochrocephala]
MAAAAASLASAERAEEGADVSRPPLIGRCRSGGRHLRTQRGLRRRGRSSLSRSGSMVGGGGIGPQGRDGAAGHQDCAGPAAEDAATGLGGSPGLQILQSGGAAEPAVSPVPVLPLPYPASSGSVPAKLQRPLLEGRSAALHRLTQGLPIGLRMGPWVVPVPCRLGRLLPDSRTCLPQAGAGRTAAELPLG